MTETVCALCEVRTQANKQRPDPFQIRSQHTEKIFPTRKNRRKSRTIVYLLLRSRDNVQYVEGHSSDTRFLSFVREDVHALITVGRCEKRYPLRTFPILLCVVLKLDLDRFLRHTFQFRFIHQPHNQRYIVPSQRHRHYITNNKRAAVIRNTLLHRTPLRGVTREQSASRLAAIPSGIIS